MTVVQALLASTEWAGCSVEAGGEILDVDVADVQLVLDVTAQDFRGGRIVMVAATPADKDWRIDVMLRRMHAAQALAVVLPNDSTIGESALRLAGALRIPIIRSAVPVVELLRRTQLLLSRYELRAARLAVEMQAALARRVVNSVDLVAEASKVLGVPVALLSPRLQTIAGNYQAPPEWGLTGTKTTWYGVPDGPLTVATPVWSIEGTTVESWLVAEVSHPTPGLQHVYIPGLEVASGALQRSRAVLRLDLDRQFRGRITLLNDVVRAGARPSPLILDRASAAGWTLQGWHMGFHFARSPSYDARTDSDFFHALMELLDQHEGHIAYAEHGEGVGGWLTVPSRLGGKRAESMAHSLRHHLRALQTSGFPETLLGVSRPYEEAGGVGQAVSEAVAAATLAVGRSASGGYVYIGRFGGAQLLLAWTGADSFQESVRDLLAPISSSPTLASTLLAYLDCGEASVEAAALLGVHRNTVTARISRIERLLEVSLNDPDTRLALHLASRSLLRRPPNVGA